MPLAGICQERQKGALCLKLHLSVCLSTWWLPAFRARFVDTGQKVLGVYEFTFVLRTIYLLFQCCFSCAESLPKESIISKPNRPLSRRIEHHKTIFLFCFFWSEILDCKEPACNAGDLDSIPGLGRFHGEGNGNPLHYSCQENPMDRGAWRATYSPWGRKKSNTTEWLSLSLLDDFNVFFFFLMTAFLEV